METRRVGIVKDGALPKLIQLDQTQPLAAVISNLCEHWTLENPENYALQWEDCKDTTRPYFVTERNRIEIKDGAVLKLTDSPAKMVQMAQESLSRGNMQGIHQTLQKMADLANDITYTQEFINRDGLKLLMSRIHTIQDTVQSQSTLGYALKAFVELMDHGIVSWDIVDANFIKVVANSVNITRNTTADATTLQMALEIFELIVTNSPGMYAVVEQEVTAVTLTDHIAKTQNPDIQKRALALINALFLKADSDKRKRIAESIQSKSIRSVILNSVIRRAGVTSVIDMQNIQNQHLIDPEMCHQLYVLQSLLTNLLDQRRNTKAEPNDQTVKEITELRRLAFDPEGTPVTNLSKQTGFVKDYKKLGFKNHANPVEDFRHLPPGILALDNMVYFAKHHREEYTKVILENTTRADDHDLPFASASIELTRMLCDTLKVGEMPSEDGRVFYPMLFTHDKPFEELFCVAIQLLNKTWKEMRAAADDFPKVLGVATEQIVRTLDKCSDNFERFKKQLFSLNYSEMTKIWQKERNMTEYGKSQARPIVELKTRIEPEILDLIKQQRLGFLVDGSQFQNKLGRRGERFWYCFLSPNYKVFYYGECEENVKPTIEQLGKKLAVVDIRRLLTGKECPHVKEKRKGHATAGLSFSIQTEQETEDYLNFIAPDPNTYNMWTDGINALISNPMTSSLAQEELDMLLTMEIKLRLLDTEGITIPNTPPPIPEDPPNYDFAYNV